MTWYNHITANISVSWAEAHTPDFFTFIAMSWNSSSEAQIFTSDCSAKTDGASNMTSSAYRNIAVQTAELIHSHIWCGDDPPTCQLCGLAVAVKHILVEFFGFRDIRTKYLQSRLLRSCFKVSTIVLLLILLKKPIFITNCNDCFSNLAQ